jgi:CubicO group peptidase (beta-lactamase class C family)
VRAPRLVLICLLALAALERGAPAQSLAYSLFERYLDSLRQQAGIPGLSAAIVQGGHVVWEAGLGQQDIEGGISAAPHTPYPVLGLTETFTVVLLGQCVDSGHLDVDQSIRRWAPQIPEPGATIRHVLAHASDGAMRGGFRYDPSRYAALTGVAEDCGDENFRRALTAEVLDRLGMSDSVPGLDLGEPSASARQLFSAERAEHYTSVLRRVATPYRVDRNGRPSRSEFERAGLNAANGLVSTVRDLARYDAALDDGVLIRRDLLNVAWRNAVSTSGGPLPTGLGWFVQNYNGERLVWHFGEAPGAYSSLILKVPGRDLTLILLANSDGLSATFSLADGDVTKSLFARLFLRTFL